jgi:flagellum-specific ATP synthase
VERAGAGKDNEQDGDITAFYTVLSEGDDMQDPVADNARAILDGHIVLSRSVADSGTYPPIDVGASVSRATSAIANAEHKKLMLSYRQLLGAYTQNEDLIKAGAYQRGQDPIIDAAISKIHLLRQYVQQSHDENISIIQSIEQLHSVVQ